MANTTITCKYQVPNTGGALSAAAIEALLAAVPVDLTVPDLYGLMLTADVTTIPAGVPTRTFTFSMVATMADATATAVLGTTDTTSGTIAAINIGTVGGLYRLPPVVTLSQKTTNPAFFRANTAPSAVIVLNGGSAYSGATKVTLVGGSGYTLVNGQPVPGATPPTATPTIIAGAITAITLTGGSFYVQPPAVVITDTGGGVGATAVVGQSVNSVSVINPGGMYGPAVPSVIFTSFFKNMVPDLGNQAAVLASFMEGVLQTSLKSGVLASTPVIT